MKEKNLICESWYNPFFAIATNKKTYELNDIIIYDELGSIVESGHGWFNELHNNNNTFKDGATIDAIHLRKKEDFTRKENFIVFDTEYWQKNRYKLYIYYKNVNFQVERITYNNFIECVYSLELPEKKIQCSHVLGDTKRKSDAKKYKYLKIIDDFKEVKYRNTEEIKKHIKELNKSIKQYEKTLSTEAEDIKKDITPFLYDGREKEYKRFIDYMAKEAAKNEQ